MSTLINGRMSYVEHGDMRVVLRTMPEACFDSCVCDPPYELGFMSKTWDKSGVAFDPKTWAEVFRVLKPGAYLLAFGGTRTWHRIAVSIEDAGFEIRDSIAWMYASGMPKSRNVARDIDQKVCKLPGRHYPNRLPAPAKRREGDHVCARSDEGDARRGIGTGLKPSFEPIIIARKPPIGTLAENVLRHGTGAMNIDAGRIACSAEDFEKLADGVDAIRERGGSMENSWKNSSDLSGANPASPLGRWPANVVLSHTDECECVGHSTEEIPTFDSSHSSRFLDRGDEVKIKRDGGSRTVAVEVWECAPGCPVAELDRQSGNRKGMSGGGKHRADYPGGMFGGIDSEGTARGDSGGASRFFFCPKTNGKERDAGLDHWPVLTGGEATDREDDTAGVNNPRAGAGRTGGRRNPHPTVKPIALMRYLIKLVTPPGGFVLDPFAGSGSTGCAAALERFHFGGVELEETHVRLARDRIAHWSKNLPK